MSEVLYLGDSVVKEPRRKACTTEWISEQSAIQSVNGRCIEYHFQSSKEIEYFTIISKTSPVIKAYSTKEWVTICTK